jgi:hypothetical protein
VQGYAGLRDVVTIRYRRSKGTIELGGAAGRLETIDPADLSDLPRLLRNSIAHFNIRPMNKNGRFGGIRVWNKDNDGEITLVADLDFDALRPLARHVLSSLASPDRDLQLDDPEDPLKTLRSKKAKSQARPAPRISTAAWDPILAAHGGDYQKAKATIDRALGQEVERLKTP